VPEALRAYQAEPFAYDEARRLADELGLSEPVAITLVRRGYRTAEQARTFLAADESHDPADFSSMGRVVERIEAAVREGERITVHGDFDVDGVCATAILVGALRELGGDCDWLIPDRMVDGYGLSEDNVRTLAERRTRLLITVDCGITAVDEVALARSLGIDVIVTDHHQPSEALPDCLTLHPTVDGYPFAELCGTAVVWKLATALRSGLSGEGSADALTRRVSGDPSPDSPSQADADLDLVALATVADVVPLVGENRAIVKKGLEEVRRARRPGIRALLEAAKCDPGQLDEGDLAFRLAPRINAAGRLYRADAGVELFLTQDDARAAEIAAELSRANGERRATERRVLQEAEAALRALPARLREAPGFVLAGEGWHPGVIGIVASRLVEQHHRPVVVVSLDGGGGGRGSGRSIPGFDLLAALDACSPYLSRFGGHRAAAGLELDAVNLDQFREAFAEHASAMLGPEDLKKTERIDAIVGGASLGLELAEELRQLAPFGMGNPGVRLLVPSARVRDVRSIGDGKHSRFSLHSGSHKALGVAFGRPSLGVDEEQSVDVAVRLEVNRWNGSVEPQVVLREVYPRATDEGALDVEAWWDRFERELAADPTSIPAYGETPPHRRLVLRTTNAPAAVARELAACGAKVLAVTADAFLRAGMAAPGLRLTDPGELALSPGLAADFRHVVVVDPLPCRRLTLALSGASEPGCYLHRAWGEAEWRFALSAQSAQLAQRETLVALYRDLRDADGAGGEELRSALAGDPRRPRGAEAAARGFRVLSELGLVEGMPNRGLGAVRVVSSEGTDLERSAAFRAYSARFQEAQRYLEGQRQP